jgi:hypothetical protein
MGPRDLSLDAAGWMEYDRAEDESRSSAGETYLESEWYNGVQENGEAGELAEGADVGGEPAGGWLIISLVLNCYGEGYGPSFNDDHT